MSILFTEAEDAYLRTVYATTTPISEMAKKLGRSEGSIYRHGVLLGMGRPRETCTHGTLTQAILKAASKPEGMHLDDLPGFKRENVGTRARHMVCEGKLFRAPNWRQTRYFTNRADADACQIAGSRPLPAKPVAKGRRWPADAPMVITAATVFTYAPKPPERVFHTNTHAR